MIHTITPATTDCKDLETKKVHVASLCGKFAVHDTCDGIGFTLTHVPSRWGIRSGIVTISDAEDLMLTLADMGDWNFRSPKSPKFLRQRNAWWKIIQKTTVHGCNW